MLKFSMTFYHKEENYQTHTSIWKRQFIQKVAWQEKTKIGTSQEHNKANYVKVFIFEKENDLSKIELCEGDIIVKGLVEKEITSQQDLDDLPSVYTVTSIADFDYSSPISRHIELVGE